ncbi:hypothetical protein [Sphingobium sp. AEW013]|uniref:hypothetical protein n=1 Tax=Sphingobium sp. AEW013 TaxID=2572915 RepID=UPI000D16CD9B|nr:hypothetical protein [Sphingobium sp. AEW013]PSO09741.1 hypothetical protein C7E20_21190 [Sphingobium sp. AEW4]
MQLGLGFLTLAFAAVNRLAGDAAGAANRALFDIIIMPRWISIDDSSVHANHNALITAYREVADPGEMTVSAGFFMVPPSRLSPASIAIVILRRTWLAWLCRMTMTGFAAPLWMPAARWKGQDRCHVADHQRHLL